jgi:hypothetical protein
MEEEESGGRGKRQIEWRKRERDRVKIIWTKLFVSSLN